jgi:hypothetical protein
MKINFEDNTRLLAEGTEVLVTNDRSYRYDTTGTVLEVERATWSYLVSFPDGYFRFFHEELLAL